MIWVIIILGIIATIIFYIWQKKSNINDNDENTGNNSDEQKPSGQNDSVNEQQPEQTEQDEETKYYTVTFTD